MKFHERDRLTNRKVTWSANVGVPVEHFDSDKLKTFETVLGVARLWAKRGEIPRTLIDAIDAFGTTEARLEEAVTDFHAIPEIAAAVQSFVMSREAVPGIYVYFDIGGARLTVLHSILLTTMASGASISIRAKSSLSAYPSSRPHLAPSNLAKSTRSNSKRSSSATRAMPSSPLQPESGIWLGMS
jgi:hypothetical protein